jgi:hypothetical protein
MARSFSAVPVSVATLSVRRRDAPPAEQGWNDRPETTLAVEN